MIKAIDKMRQDLADKGLDMESYARRFSAYMEKSKKAEAELLEYWNYLDARERGEFVVVPKKLIPGSESLRDPRSRAKTLRKDWKRYKAGLRPISFFM
jgi:hypothetical protein